MSRSDDSFVLFCGRPSDDHIAETRIEVRTNDDFDAALVEEIFSPWDGAEPVYRSIGQFQKSRR